MRDLSMLLTLLVISLAVLCGLALAAYGADLD